jgi:hypothetical protein
MRQPRTYELRTMIFYQITVIYQLKNQEVQVGEGVISG